MTISQIITLIQSILTSFGIVAGGFWAYFHYFQGRIYNRRLEAQINGRIITSEDANYLIATARLTNLGLSKVEIQQRGSGLRVLSYSANAPTDAPDFYGVEATHLGTFSVFESHSWIESKEKIDDEIMICIRESRLIALRLELRVVTAKTSWRDVKIIEMPKTMQTHEDSIDQALEVENG